MTDKAKEFARTCHGSKWAKIKMKIPRKVKVPRKRVTPKEDLEAAVQKEGLVVLRKMGIPAWRQNAGKVFKDGYWIQLAPAGAADVTGILPDGRRLEAEAKRRYGGIHSDDQKKFQKKIEAFGGVYVLFHSGQELMEKLQAEGYCKNFKKSI